MLISNIINDSFGLLSKQLRFYCWHFRRNLDKRQRQELLELLYEQRFERLAQKIRALNQDSVADCKQQIGKLLLSHCLTHHRRHQLIQLIESGLVDINVRLDNYARTLLHTSAYNLDVELVRILIDHGVNIRLRDYAGNTALHIAIQSYRNGAVIFGNGQDVVQNLTSIIRLLLEADRNLLFERSKRKRTKLLSDENDGTTTGSNIGNQILTTSGPFVERSRDEIVVDNNEISPTQTYSLAAQPRKEKGSSLTSSKPSPSPPINGPGNLDHKSNQSLSPQQMDYQKDHEFSRQTTQPDDNSTTTTTINPILLEDASSPLVDTKNAFGRTALHYCVSVVGEQHLAHFVQLLISFGADTDATDTRMKTPLYCLVKRPGISAVRQKCQAITHLLNSGCDDLGLAIDPHIHFDDKIVNDLEQNISNILQSRSESPLEPIFTNTTFKRVPTLKHLARLRLIRLHDEKNQLKRQTRISLLNTSPASLNLYINRRILDQSELF